MKSVRLRQRVPRRSFGTRIVGHCGLLAIIGALLIGAAPGHALAEVGGNYILQCFCPLEWSAPWDGAGVFNEDESLDTVALADDGAVLLIHEIPIGDGTLAGMIEERGDSLARGANIEDLEDAWEDESDEDAIAGRIWINGDGETVYSFQYVQVWETNFLLSIEFIAPEDEFVEAWDSLELVLLIGSPVLGEFDGEDVAGEIGDGGSSRG